MKSIFALIFLLFEVSIHLLFLSLHESRFNPVMLGGKKKVIHTNTNLQLETAGLRKYVWPFVTTRH